MTTRFIDAGGVALRYELAGHGERTVVLLHEMGGTLESWDLVWPKLGELYRTLRFDMRGFGLSEKIRGPVTVEQLADDLHALLDAVGLPGKAALVGCAVGGAVALCFAARYPARTAAVIVSSPATGVPPPQRQATRDNIARFEQMGLRSIEEASLAASYPPALRQDQARFAATRARWLGNDLESFAAVYRMLVELELGTALAGIAAPSLLIGCTLDAVRPPDWIRAVAAQIPRARFETAQSGHFLAIQSPDILLGLLLPFLDEHLR